MSRVEASLPFQERQGGSLLTPRWRFPVLCLFLTLAIGCHLLLARLAPPPDGPTSAFIALWLVSFLPYLAACLLVLATRAPTGSRQSRELTVILGGALILRVLLLPIPPDLSHDAWRYLWDARVTLHGSSPYVYPPNHPLLLHLRDVLYENSRYRNVPTIYPPGAQAFYLLSYLLAPGNMVVLKALLIGCDLVTTGALALLLKKRGTDPARCLLYGWCPLPIVEFALQGHVDALTITLMLLTILCAQSVRRGARILTGFLLALATLSKIYPIVLLVVVLRRRDWTLLTTCSLTMVLTSIPYLLLSHGQIVGFFPTYIGEQHAANAGAMTLAMHWMSSRLGLTSRGTYLVDIVIISTTTLLTWRWRQKEQLSMEAATLILIGAIFLVSTHVFPWYTPALLPWVAVLIGVPQTQQQGWKGLDLAIGMAWYFASTSILSYLVDDDWNWYYLLVYGTTLLGLGAAAFMELAHRRKK